MPGLQSEPGVRDPLVREGDAVTLSTPAGDERLEVLAIRYEELK
jgi:hydrogenase maturation factor